MTRAESVSSFVGTGFATGREMQLSATVTAAELRTLAHSLLPLRIDLRGDEDDEQRWLDVTEPSEAKLIPDDAVTLAVRAAIRWPERAVFDEFNVERIELRLEPRVEPNEEGGVALVLRLQIGDLDVAWIPDFVSEAVAGSINKRLQKSALELRWDFSDTLSVSFDKQGEHSNIERVSLDLRTAKLEIGSEAVRIEAPMIIDVHHAPPDPMDAQMAG